MIYAVYRCLYGEDFIQESIDSITDHVDKIFVFWDDKPWADVDHCVYKGERVDYPKKFDNILEKIKELNNPKVELIHDHVYNNINQFAHFTNDIILKNYDRPSTIMVIEVDHVYRKDQLEQSLEEVDFIRKKHDLRVQYGKQVEIWKGFKHKIPERERIATVFWDMSKTDVLPHTGRAGEALNQAGALLNGTVHNYGFAVSEKTMYWKHMTAIGFSQKIGDSGPNEDWFEKVWKSWDFENNNKNLEISKGYEHLIPYAEPYNIEEHPEQIYKKIFKK